mgnify:CR=1 FL=1
MANILLVSDEDEFREIFHLALGKTGHTILQADNLETSLAHLRQTYGADLVITDLGLGSKGGPSGGITIARKALELKVKVVILTMAPERAKAELIESRDGLRGLAYNRVRVIDKNLPLDRILRDINDFASN